MGGGASTFGTETIRKDWMDVFKAMKLQHGEVQTLYNIYNKVDADHSGSIDVVELLTLLDIERTAFTERIFSAFDKDHTGKIDFYEFVVSLWKFCTLGNGSLNVFAFDLYDSDADGMLTTEQVQKMFRELFGAKMMESETAKAGMAELLRKAVSDELSTDVFIAYCKYHQALLAPVFTIQEKLKHATLGGQTWEAISMRKIEVHAGRTMPIRELMVLHANRKLFRSLLQDQTVLRVSSMMRIVLENSDNNPRVPTPPSSPTHKDQRRTYIIDPTAGLRGSRDSHDPRGSRDSHDNGGPGITLRRGSKDSHDDEPSSRRASKGEVRRGSRDARDGREGREDRASTKHTIGNAASPPRPLPKSLLHA